MSLYAQPGIFDLETHAAKLTEMGDPLVELNALIDWVAARIAQGSQEKLGLGNMAIQRDWGWAPDYVDAMWRMLHADEPDDYVVVAGRTVSLEYFTARVFEQFGLDWNEHIEIDQALLRPTDILVGRADPTKAMAALGWHPTVDVDGVISKMCKAIAA